MSLDVTDFVDNLLDEEARVNGVLIDQPDTNVEINDLQTVSDPLGMTETVSPAVTHGPHDWDDGQTAWGFWSWDT